MQITENLTYEEALKLAQAVALVVRERIMEAESARRQPCETIQAIKDARLIRVLMPKRWSGFELSFGTLVETVKIIARVDASAAWCYGFLLMHAWLLAHFPDEAQRDVWAAGPDVPLAVSIIPAGEVTLTEGGYALSGSWPYVSGIDHCTWAILMGKVPVSEGPAQMRYFLVPEPDYQIRDTWFTYGLKASGSNTVMVSGAFVPTYRTVALRDLMVHGQAPGAILNASSLYQVSVPEAFPLPLVAALTGAAQGAYERAREHVLTSHSTLTREPIAQKTHVQIRLASIYEEIRASELLLRHALRTIWQASPFSKEVRSEIRLHYATIAQRCRAASEELYISCGGGANALGHPMGRSWVDIHAMAAHARLHFDQAAEGFGRSELGLPANQYDPYAS